MRTLLRGGRVLCPVTGLEEHADVLIEDGFIVRVELGASADDAELVDCSGLVVAPALVDLDAELCDPGLTWREDLVTASAAAARGGFTAVLASPATNTVADDAAVIRELLTRARDESSVEVLAAGALTRGLAGEHLAELGLMAEAGAVAFSNGTHLVPNTLVLRNALLYARPFGLPVLLRAGEGTLESGGVMHEGYSSNLAGLRGLPAAAEEMAVARLAALARYTGAHVHITGVSTRLALEILAIAKDDDVAITASTTALSTLLTDDAVLQSSYDSSTRLLPPLRTEDDRNAIIDALDAGLLTGAASAHRPRTRVDKELEFALAEPGASTLETALSCVVAGTGSLEVALRDLSAGPASILGLDRRVAAGAPADLVVLDASATWTVDPEASASRSRNTPLGGRELPVVVRRTLRAGVTVWAG